MGIGTSPITTLNGDKGGIYYVRKVDNDIWWYAKDKDGQWSHVFKGVFINTYKIIVGEWAGISKGQSSKNGKVELTIINDNEANVSWQTGGFVDIKLKEKSAIGPTEVVYT